MTNDTPTSVIIAGIVAILLGSVFVPIFGYWVGGALIFIGIACIIGSIIMSITDK